MAPQSAQDAQAYVRIAAISLFAYDYLRTIPEEWRFFSDQRKSGRYSLGWILFTLVRYVGLLAVVFPTISFFSHAFKGKDHACLVVIYFVVYLRCIATTLASIVLARRTWAICRKDRKLGWILTILIVIIVALEFWSQSYKTISTKSGTCSGGNPHPKIAIIFYAANLSFDLLLTILTSAQLFKNMSGSGFWPPFSAFLLKEGLIYLLVVTAFNVVNCVFWSLPSSSGLQSIGATIAVAMNSIMAQHVVLSLRDPSNGSRSRSGGNSSGGGASQSGRGRSGGAAGGTGANKSIRHKMQSGAALEMGVRVDTHVLTLYEKQQNESSSGEKRETALDIDPKTPQYPNSATYMMSPRQSPLSPRSQRELEAGMDMGMDSPEIISPSKDDYDFHIRPKGV